MPYTKAHIRQQLRDSRAWLERGILVIYERHQTAPQSQWQDGVGFSESDADYLCYLARWIEAGKQLNGKHLRRARALMMKYAGQLAEIANASPPHKAPSDINDQI